MTENGICSLLGLAKRAGKLAAGDEPVRGLAREGVVRVLFLASDAGAAVARQASFIAERAKAPLLVLPVSKEELGGALGRRTCALCAVSDSGFAAKAAEKLAAADPAFQAAAEKLRAEDARIRSRRGIKQTKTLKNKKNTRSPFTGTREGLNSPRPRRSGTEAFCPLFLEKGAESRGRASGAVRVGPPAAQARSPEAEPLAPSAEDMRKTSQTHYLEVSANGDRIQIPSP